MNKHVLLWVATPLCIVLPVHVYEREREREFFVYVKMINMVQVDSRSARQQGHILISSLIISDLYHTAVSDLFYLLCLCQFI